MSASPAEPERNVHDNEPYRYDLDEEEVLRRTARLLEHMPAPTDQRFICYQLGDTEMEDVARTIERTVFETSFDNSNEKMSQIYGPYESASRFFLSVDRIEGKPVGALRVTENSPAGMMTLNALPEDASNMNSEQLLEFHGIDSLDDCWDVGTVAVLPEYRRQGQGISVQLYRALYVSAMKEDVSHLLSIIDRRPYETMRNYLGIPFEPLGDSKPFPFEGSEESVAVHGFIPDFYSKMRRQSLTIKGLLARKALWPLVFGTKDQALMLGDDYKK